MKHPIYQILYNAIRTAMEIDRERAEGKIQTSLAGFYTGTLERDALLQKRVEAASPEIRAERDRKVALLKSLHNQGKLDPLYSNPKSDSVDETASKLSDLLDIMRKNETEGRED